LASLEGKVNFPLYKTYFRGMAPILGHKGKGVKLNAPKIFLRKLVKNLVV
jgi:hypothetical protein